MAGLEFVTGYGYKPSPGAISPFTLPNIADKLLYYI